MNATTTYARTERALNAIRPVRITRNYTRYAEGSVLIEVGTRMCCAPPRSKSACRRTSAAAAKAG